MKLNYILFKNLLGAVAVLTALAFTAHTAFAQIDVATPSSLLAQNDELLKLSPSQSEIIHLPKDAASVIVANPAHARILLDSPRTMIVLPGAPGATSFKVLDMSGNIILKRDVIITSTMSQHVRIRRLCKGNAADCVANAYYYCPDGCYEMNAMSAEDASQPVDVPAPLGGGSSEQDDAGTATSSTKETSDDEEEEELVEEEAATPASKETTPPPAPTPEQAQPTTAPAEPEVKE